MKGRVLRVNLLPSSKEDRKKQWDHGRNSDYSYIWPSAAEPGTSRGSGLGAVQRQLLPDLSWYPEIDPIGNHSVGDILILNCQVVATAEMQIRVAGGYSVWVFWLKSAPVISFLGTWTGKLATQSPWAVIRGSDKDSDKQIAGLPSFPRPDARNSVHCGGCLAEWVSESGVHTTYLFIYQTVRVPLLAHQKIRAWTVGFSLLNGFTFKYFVLGEIIERFQQTMV